MCKYNVAPLSPAAKPAVGYSCRLGIGWLELQVILQVPSASLACWTAVSNCLSCGNRFNKRAMHDER